MKKVVAETAEKVERVLSSLRKLFVPEARFSFIVRVPGQPETELIVSDDNLEEVQNLLQHYRTKIGNA